MNKFFTTLVNFGVMGIVTAIVLYVLHGFHSGKQMDANSAGIVMAGLVALLGFVHHTAKVTRRHVDSAVTQAKLETRLSIQAHGDDIRQHVNNVTQLQTGQIAKLTNDQTTSLEKTITEAQPAEEVVVQPKFSTPKHPGTKKP